MWTTRLSTVSHRDITSSSSESIGIGVVFLTPGVRVSCFGIGVKAQVLVSTHEDTVISDHLFCFSHVVPEAQCWQDVC